MWRATPSALRARDDTRARSLGVTIEAQYSVGEYDILILSAQQSAGLETWLRQNGYRIPAGASSVLASSCRAVRAVGSTVLRMFAGTLIGRSATPNDGGTSSLS